MRTHLNLFTKLCSEENLNLAYQKARKGKSSKSYVNLFESNLEFNIKQLRKELEEQTYKPKKLKKFIIRDPKTRTIHASAFRDRVVHHAVVNILQPIYEGVFIYDSFASRKGKGSHEAVTRFETFLRRVSDNGSRIKQGFDSNSIQGYVLKADIKKYFDNMDHDVLIRILEKKIKDDGLISLVRVILESFGEKGVPLGNYTSQFFANVYLNELDYFVKHSLHARCYIRYVDDFVILHRNKEVLSKYMLKIEEFLRSLNLELHPDKSEIHALRNGIGFLGYRVFSKYRLLRKRNLRYFFRKLRGYEAEMKEGLLTKEKIRSKLEGWFGYAQHANTYGLRKKIINRVLGEAI